MNPYPRFIVEIANSQSYVDLVAKCQRWLTQPYVRYVLGIKLYDKRVTQNAQGQYNRTMTVDMKRLNSSKCTLYYVSKSLNLGHIMAPRWPGVWSRPGRTFKVVMILPSSNSKTNLTGTVGLRHPA